MWLLYASAAAAAFGMRGILYHWTSKLPVERNLLLCGVFLTGCLLSLAGGLLTKQPWSPAALVGVVMGSCSFIANASMFKGFAVGKASLVATLSALPPVVVAALAYLFWNEKLSVLQLAAFVVIVAGVLLIRYSRELTLDHLAGAKWGLLAMLFFGLNDLSSKWSTMLGSATFPTLFFMFVTGSALFLAAWLRERRAAAAARGDAWPAGRTLGTGMMIGTTNIVGMVLALQAFHSGTTGLVSAVVSLNVLLILLYGRLVVKERFSARELAGMAAAIGGVLLLRLLG